MSTSELACTYAALILHDDAISVTAEKIATLVKAAGLTVESYWPSLFAKLSSKRNIDDLILNVGSAAASAPLSMASSSSADASAAPAPAPAPVEKKEEAVEESEDDLVFGLFD
ncbi:60S acidic ribosomal protein P1-like isoform X2 [Momordica charantia]|uniref:60S acidic ribosomal protein P1-like isoform X2 n=1 Tax=Momordica charantia TaxID=3673 RepID=A0A6J1C9A3_MOMCH|nr:60S acidic ribosomal protein P1-like isoform X2 [Momordica charantia]